MGDPLLLIAAVALLLLCLPAAWMALRGWSAAIAGGLFVSGTLLTVAWTSTLTTHVRITNDGREPVLAYSCPSTDVACRPGDTAVEVRAGATVSYVVSTRTSLVLVLLSAKAGKHCLALGSVAPHVVPKVAVGQAITCGAASRA